MTRTLADMTPAERAACVGRWCKISGRHLAVLSHIWGDEQEGVVVFPRGAHQCAYDFAELTPRFDLPRAWTPSGKPPAGEWDDDQGRNLMRRWVSDWEWKHDTPQHIRDEHERKA